MIETAQAAGPVRITSTAMFLSTGAGGLFTAGGVAPLVEAVLGLSGPGGGPSA